MDPALRRKAAETLGAADAAVARAAARAYARCASSGAGGERGSRATVETHEAARADHHR